MRQLTHSNSGKGRLNIESEGTAKYKKELGAKHGQ